MPQATSVVGICNLALARLGQNPITSLDQASVHAQLCAKNYDTCRQAMLHMYPWGFAKKRASLPALEAAPVWEYTHAYQLPSDHLWTVKLHNCDDLAYDIEGRTLVISKAAPLKMLYIRDEEDPVKFSPLFIDAFADRLAGELVYAIKKDLKLREPWLRTAEMKAQMGKTRDSQESSVELIEGSTDLIDVRHGGVPR